MLYVCAGISFVVVMISVLIMGLARSMKMGTISEARRGIRPEDHVEED